MAKKIRKSATKSKPRHKTEELELPIRHVFADDHLPVASNHGAIHRTAQEVSLMFFYARPPVFGGEPAEVEKHIDNLKVVDARCVAEVVMHPAQFLKFASIIQDQAINIVENYKAVREKLASSSGESTEIKP